MISDASYYQEMLSLDAMMQYYFNAELHVNQMKLATWSFHVFFIVTPLTADKTTTGAYSTLRGFKMGYQ